MKHRQANRTIKHELKRRGLKQTQAALDLGISISRFNLIANGWEHPGPTQRAKIAQYLNMPEAALFRTSRGEAN